MIGCKKDYYNVNNDGIIHYPSNRGDTLISVKEKVKSNNYTKKIITFNSKDIEVYADLYIPNYIKKENIAIVWIPAAGKRRIDAVDRGEAFAEFGITTLILDLRGLGNTKGEQKTFEEELNAFSEGREPYNHLVIYDTLKAVDAMRELGYKCILVGGESNGGRIALIAGQIDNSINGLLLMSTAGFGYFDHSFFEIRKFFASVNPDNYAPLLKIPVAFVHDKEDPTITFNAAETTYNKINSNKKMFTISKRCHGYCQWMNNVLNESIEFLRQETRC